MKPATLIIEHTLDTLEGLSIKRRIEILEALYALTISKDERGFLKTQIDALANADRANRQLLLNLRTQRAA
jgi:hypothetical protein